MAQLFPPISNIIAKLSLIVAVLAIGGLAGVGYYVVRSPFVTEVGVAKEQPVPYSHKQHVGDLGLDCRYCHTAVEQSNTAGIPATATCMGCHAQVATDSPVLEPVRMSLDEEQPLAWIRVHDLADYVYFNHALHVRQGVGCETCHGRIDLMPVVAKTQNLQMDWCLDCHRKPEQYIRPRDKVFAMGWEPPADQTMLGLQLVEEYGIHVEPLTDCSICHR